MPSPTLPPYRPSICSVIWKFSKPAPVGLFMEAVLHRHNWLHHWVLTISLIFYLRFDAEAKSPNSLIMPWSFWWPAAILKLSRILQALVISFACERHCHFRGSKGFKSYMSGNREDNQILLCGSQYLILRSSLQVFGIELIRLAWILYLLWLGNLLLLLDQHGTPFLVLGDAVLPKHMAWGYPRRNGVCFQKKGRLYSSQAEATVYCNTSVRCIE